MTHNDYIKQIKRHGQFVLFMQIISLLIFLIAWEITTYWGILDPFIFSSPSRVFKSLYLMALDGSLFYHTGITLFETLLGFILGTSIGTLFAILLWWNKTLYEILEPSIIVFNSLPKTAFGPILIVWFGNSMTSIILMSILISVVVTTLNVLTGFQEVDQDKIRLIYSFGGTKKTILTKILLPNNIPTFINIFKVNIGLCLVGVIIGEFLVAKAGLGYLIVYGSQVFKLDWVMLSILILGLLSVLLFKCIHIIDSLLKKYIAS